MRASLLKCLTCLWFCAGDSVFLLQAADTAVDYLKEIKPVLRERCYACHGALKQNGGLRLDTASLLTKGGESGPAIESGAAASSLLLRRVSTADESERMPPEGNPLTASQIAALKNWIDQGAASPADESPERDPRDHWAFRRPVRPELPVVKNQDWVLTPVDAFIAAERERRGLSVQHAADKRNWLRRVTLDLIGLPPTLEEMTAFIDDHSPDAYAQVVNRLLDSPQYGERWGRHWMDIWRYSDPWGLGDEIRNSQRHIWHWRDWIVESLNADVGYDQMLREMIAADELYPQDLDKLRASGFLARQYFKFNRTVWLDETIEHLSKAMLGLTLNCAKCHDHKYDPITQQDYYRFRAIFEPYQIRIDLLPGETNIEKAGLPRAFDCNLEAPTFLHIRGDDRNPDKSHSYDPGVPGFLQTEEWVVNPVELPIDSVQPGLRPFVVEAHLRDADNNIALARSKLVEAEKALAAAIKGEESARVEQAAATIDDPAVEIRDDFSRERPELWQQRGGEWNYADGRLKQSQVGAMRAVISLKSPVPRDFEARFKFVVTGGTTWKSVGICFDTTGPEHDVLAYLSAYAGGPKSQVCYKLSGQDVYPAEGTQPRDVALNQPHEIIVRVRGQIVNMTVDGQHSIAYRLPIERQTGALELIAFDAQAEFQQFSLRALPGEFQLIIPEGAAVASRREAELRLALAQKVVETALTLPETVRARSAADQAVASPAPPENLSDIIRIAARAERLTLVKQADEAVTIAEIALLKAPPDKQGDATKKLEEARQALVAAQTSLDTPSTSYTRLPGAIKTAESNLESAESQTRPFPGVSTGRRTALARWMTDAQNPLTARVAVNHIWARHIGKPLASTVFEFGRKGALPSHPELLDWLADEMMEHQWSMKHIHRLIVLSNTYRMTSSTANADPATLAADPDNRCYWHATSVRLEAQAVRDSLLFLAGELDLTRGGPPVPVSDETSRRRSLYFVHSHNDHQKFLSMFDDASVLDCYRRSESIVPQQALALENSPFTAAMADKIAQRIVAANPGLSESEFVRCAFLWILCTDPNEAELVATLDALKQLTKLAKQKNHPQPESSARSAIILALLNHNDFVTVR